MHGLQVGVQVPGAPPHAQHRGPASVQWRGHQYQLVASSLVWLQRRCELLVLYLPATGALRFYCRLPRARCTHRAQAASRRTRLTSQRPQSVLAVSRVTEKHPSASLLNHRPPPGVVEVVFEVGVSCFLRGASFSFWSSKSEGGAGPLSSFLELPVAEKPGTEKRPEMRPPRNTQKHEAGGWV
jgi:hypothetical protein